METRSIPVSVFQGGGGVSGALFRSRDWALSPLGPIDGWPRSLKIALGMMFASRHPMFLFWGAKHISFYNDGYLPSFGHGKHPSAMGRPGEEVWPEIWPIIGPQIRSVMERGEATWNVDHLVPIFRDGKIEDVYWTYSYSPVFDEEGAVGGTLVVCTETTSAVLADRRAKSIHQLLERAPTVDIDRDVRQLALDVARSNPGDIPFFLFYQHGADHPAPPVLVERVGLEDALLAGIEGACPFAEALQGRASVPFTRLAPDGEPMREGREKQGEVDALVVPLVRPEAPEVQGFIVFGVSARLPWDRKYREYLELVASLVATALGHVERKQLERDLRSSDELLKVITAQVPAFIAYMDREGRYRFVNQAYEDWFGLPAREIQGKRRMEFATGETARLAAPYERKALDGEVARYENVLRKPSGEFVELKVDYLPHRDPRTGEVRGAVVVGHDITELKRAHREAEAARRDLHETFMQAPVGICVLEGPEHRFSLANPTYVDTLFEKGRTLVGMTVREALPGIEGQGFLELLDRVYRSGEPFVGSELPVRIDQPDGTQRAHHLNFIYQPRRDSGGRVDGILVVLYDVSELVKARQDMEHAVRSRDEFMSIASHELKTPLTALQLQAQMALRSLDRSESEAVQPARVRRLVDQTDRAVQRLNRLVDDMLDVSRISTGKLTFQLAPVDLFQLAQEIVDRMGGQFRAAGVSLAVEGEGPVTGQWDRFRIEQVVTNLLTNALRYGGRSPVDVSVQAQGGMAVLRVRDRGPGIDEANHDRIFQRFERATPASSVSGLGLGLYISRQIVDRHGGRLRLESRAGQGATFVMELPIDRPNERSKASPRHPGPETWPGASAPSEG